MKTFFLLLVGAIVAAIVMTCSSVHAGQLRTSSSEKQAYCTGLANIAGSVAQAIHGGTSTEAITKDVEDHLRKSGYPMEIKSAIRAAVSFAIGMVTQHNISAEIIAKYQYYGCLMST